MTTTLCEDGQHHWVYVGAKLLKRYCSHPTCTVVQVRDSKEGEWRLYEPPKKKHKRVYASLNQKRFKLRDEDINRARRGEHVTSRDG